MHVLPTGSLLPAFLVASFILAITPGPGVFYVVMRSVAEGVRHGLASVAGVALGNLGNAIGASLGLAALFALSSVAFTFVKFAGVLYLIYLGVQAMRSPGIYDAPQPAAPAPLRRAFRDGFVVALLNPKTAIFFAAFLPQFMNAETVIVCSEPRARFDICGNCRVHRQRLCRRGGDNPTHPRSGTTRPGIGALSERCCVHRFGTVHGARGD